MYTIQQLEETNSTVSKSIWRISKSSKFVPNSVSIIVKLTNSCNYGCKYCYISGPLISSDKKEFSNHKYLSDLYNKLANSKTIKYVNLISHGGEPLLLGKKFFKDMINVQKEILKDKQIVSTIQTNGSLIDEEWVEFFKKNNFHVGISLDGPENLHREQRPSLSGDSFEQTIKGIQILQENGIKFHCLSVVTKKLITYNTENLFYFFLDNGINSFEFLPQDSVIDSNGNILSEDIYFTNEYADFIIKLFDVWYEHNDPNVHILLFEDIIRTLLGNVTKSCQIGKGMCANAVFTYYPDGTLQPCDKFPRAYDNSENLITKLSEVNSFDDVFTLDKQKSAILSQVKSFKMCDGCPWIKKCRGGCVFDRYMYFRLGLDKTNTFRDCPTYKLYGHIAKRLMELKVIKHNLEPSLYDKNDKMVI
jgi:uncharacterized protein